MKFFRSTSRLTRVTPPEQRHLQKRAPIQLASGLASRPGLEARGLDEGFGRTLLNMVFQMSESLRYFSFLASWYQAATTRRSGFFTRSSVAVAGRRSSIATSMFRNLFGMDCFLRTLMEASRSVTLTIPSATKLVTNRIGPTNHYGTSIIEHWSNHRELTRSNGQGYRRQAPYCCRHRKRPRFAP